MNRRASLSVCLSFALVVLALVGCEGTAPITSATETTAMPLEQAPPDQPTAADDPSSGQAGRIQQHADPDGRWSYQVEERPDGTKTYSFRLGGDSAHVSGSLDVPKAADVEARVAEMRAEAEKRAADFRAEMDERIRQMEQRAKEMADRFEASADDGAPSGFHFQFPNGSFRFGAPDGLDEEAFEAKMEELREAWEAFTAEAGKGGDFRFDFNWKAGDAAAPEPVATTQPGSATTAPRSAAPPAQLQIGAAAGAPSEPVPADAPADAVAAISERVERYMRLGAAGDLDGVRALVAEGCAETPVGRVESTSIFGQRLELGEMTVVVTAWDGARATAAVTTEAKLSVKAASGSKKFGDAGLEGELRYDIQDFELPEITLRGELGLVLQDGQWLVTCEEAQE